MNYSAGMVSQVFAFVETKQTAELMAAGMSKDEIKDKVFGENLYQLRNETRLRRTFNYVYNRLSSLPEGAVELLVKVDNENAKLLALIAIMNTDKLFFEHDKKATLDFKWMLGVCYGNSLTKGVNPEDTTCDAHRGNTELAINPFDELSVRKSIKQMEGFIQMIHD